MVRRADVERESTAVLVCGAPGTDPVRVGCVRLVMAAACSTVRDLLAAAGELELPSDERGRTLIHAPFGDVEAMRDAVDVLHGCLPDDVGALGTPAAVAAVMRCMEYLGCTVYDTVLDARLWAQLALGPSPTPPDDVAAYVPRLLRSGHAAAVVNRLLVERPLWADFSAHVLGRLEEAAGADPRLIDTLVEHTRGFFPPAFVACWGIRACRGVGVANRWRKAVDVARRHGALYHPGEHRATLLAMLRVLRDQPDEGCPGLGGPGLGLGAGGCVAAEDIARMVVASTGRFTSLPTRGAGEAAPAAVHATVLNFSDIPVTSVCVALESGQGARCLPSSARLSRWLTLRFLPWDQGVGLAAPHQPVGALDLSFVPARMSAAVHRCRRLQLRVLAVVDADAPGERCSEAWFLFHNVAPWHALRLEDAYAMRGSGDDVDAELASGRVSQLRLDFFAGDVSVLDDPDAVLQMTAPSPSRT